ncbi:MAG: YhcH/YjgK/YiaL family protein [Tannerella sp.]|jgi:YhcH/YjgK/YiaL family protein|nr:YhcH/YjgK/YiaL family protein [Tannerella sp.]
MKKTIRYLFTFLGFIAIGCNSNSSKIDGWSDEKVNEWFLESNWNKDLPYVPDANINKRLFIQQQEKNPETWRKAFDFLKNEDLSELPEGRYDLSDNGLYATVSVYQTKKPEDAKYEAHRKYIDIQYVAEGEEYIEILPLEMIKEAQNYDGEADIMFFESKTKGSKLLADKSRFFVFFPTDAHKPCLMTDTTKTVKKIVVKIPVSE